jgi:hypothetical protein
MNPRVRIGVACPVLSERAAFLEWLSAAGYEPVPMLDLSAVGSGEMRSYELMIADTALAPARALPLILKHLGQNRPLILVGDPGQAPECVLRDLSWLDRPVTPDVLLLSVALSLAEGRPARRSPRKHVSPIESSIDGVNAQVLDVSAEGVRLALAGPHAAVLPPLFTMRVPAFGVVTTVKRVWVAQPAPRSVWCGGTVVGTSPRAVNAWRTLVDTVPTSGTTATETTPFG